MTTYLIVSVIAGVLFGVMDAAINGNTLARKLFAIYEPIAKTEINIPVGLTIDLIYGFVMAGLFLILYDGLPGDTGFVKGVSFAGIAWFFRVVMSAATTWMTVRLPRSATAYTLLTGLGEMLVLGILFGLTLTP
jgi:hypothetical protein